VALLPLLSKTANLKKNEKKNNIKLLVVKPPLNFPDLTGWGV